jgi:hypothetical protein
MNAVFISLTLPSPKGRGSRRRRYGRHRFSSAVKELSIYELWLGAQKMTLSDPPF